jgi:predicted DNA-binding helix-hairpin-helix protein
MDRRQRLAVLSEAAGLDRDSRLTLPARITNQVGISGVRLPGGGNTTLMRIMQTNACSLSCGYCPTFCGGKVKRATLSPEEAATTFMEAHRAGLVNGLFLTSGVPGRPVKATDRMLATVEILRRRERFEGYVHVKLLPGAEAAQVEAAARWADRISVNLEAPTDAHVHALAKEKHLTGDLLPKLELAGRLLRERGGAAGTTTQFVVGAAGERDREILGLVARLESHRLLHHSHFSAFQPVVGTPFEGLEATPAARELRLYQAEHLLRQYGFTWDELPFERDGNLPLDDDPKTAWASAHPERFPVEIRTASYQMLLRVPGLGPKAARTILAERRGTVFRDGRDLARAGVDVVRAGYFLTLRGRRLATTLPPHQLRLFPAGKHLTQAAWKTSSPPCAYR